MGKKEFEPVCTPDGWTLPSKSFIGSLNETRYNGEKYYRDQFDQRCRTRVSMAKEVMRLIDRILGEERLTSRSNEIDFAVSNLGFSVFDEDEVPHLVHQDPKHQIDI